LIICIRSCYENKSQKLLFRREKDPPRKDDSWREDGETEAIDAALNLVVFRKEILKSLEKVADKGGVEKVF
jgi:hypothetical protein